MQIVLEKRGLTRLIIIKWKFFAGYGKDTFSRDIPYTKKIPSLSYLIYLRLIKRVAIFSTLFFFPLKSRLPEALHEQSQLHRVEKHGAKKIRKRVYNNR